MSRTERMFRLAQLLGRRRPWRVVDLARELEVNRRTIYRDLDELSACCIPVVQEGGGWRLLEGSPAPPLRLDAGERAVLMLALGNPVIERQASLSPALKSLRSKLLASAAAIQEAPEVLRLASIDRSGAISEEVRGALERGAGEGRQVRILYQSLSGGDRRWRGLDPYELFHRADAWYVVGRCHVNDELRTFRLDRIARARPTDRRFQRPLDFQLDRYVEDSWAVYQGPRRWEAVIHFEPGLAPLIENARHHPGERKRRLGSGEIEYQARVSHLDEIARWIVGFEGRARAIAPPELRERVSELAAAVVVAHRQPAQRAGKEGGGKGKAKEGKDAAAATGS